MKTRSVSVVALAAPCAHLLARRWALRNGLRPWEASLVAWAAGTLVSAVVVRL
ncbi:hypothetical protein ACFRMQ_11170 [Kitasatospora sp. NPDC056783]|uniref:hypothetical protein n=1 Tax=Kitasatospora sp. NPDC056783 TaxID=3345943 RepID=UPI0036BDEC25